MSDTKGLFWVLGLLTLIAGFTVGALWSPIADVETVEVEKPVIVTQEVIKEVPVEVIKDGIIALDTTLLNTAVSYTVDEIGDED